MACLYCNKPVRQNEPMDCCLECEWNHVIRNQALDEIFFYTREESMLKKKLVETKKRLREAEKRYNDMWKKLDETILQR